MQHLWDASGAVLVKFDDAAANFPIASQPSAYGTDDEEADEEEKEEVEKDIESLGSIVIGLPKEGKHSEEKRKTAKTSAEKEPAKKKSQGSTVSARGQNSGEGTTTKQTSAQSRKSARVSGLRAPDKAAQVAPGRKVTSKGRGG